MLAGVDLDRLADLPRQVDGVRRCSLTWPVASSATSVSVQVPSSQAAVVEAGARTGPRAAACEPSEFVAVMRMPSTPTRPQSPGCERLSANCHSTRYDPLLLHPPPSALAATSALQSEERNPSNASARATGRKHARLYITRPAPRPVTTSLNAEDDVANVVLTHTRRSDT